MSDTVLCFESADSMSGTVTNESEGGEQREVNRRYLIGPCLGFNDCVSKIGLYAPTYVDGDGAGLYWVRRALKVQAVGNRYFDTTATYKTLVPKAPEDPQGDGQDPNNPSPGSIAWDTTGNTEHIYQAYTETPHPNTAPGFNRAIGVSNQSVDGVSVVRPGMRFSETWIFPAAVAMAEDYIANINKLTGTVNQEKFRAFAAGEALFMGARCQWQGDQPYATLTFDFDCRPNVAAFSVGGDVPNFAKRGWQYVWIRYGDDLDAGNLVKKPIAAYLNDVYLEALWDALQITQFNLGRPVAPRIPLDPAIAAAVAANGPFAIGA